jgi:hypothetical protein
MLCACFGRSTPPLPRSPAVIVDTNRTEAEWGAVESDDMFERGPYVGGYDADERAFTFSVHADDGELWFQFTLDEARSIVAGRVGQFALDSPRHSRSLRFCLQEVARRSVPIVARSSKRTTFGSAC